MNDEKNAQPLIPETSSTASPSPASKKEKPWVVDDENPYGQSLLHFGDTLVRLETLLARKLRDAHNLVLRNSKASPASLLIEEEEKDLGLKDADVSAVHPPKAATKPNR